MSFFSNGKKSIIPFGQTLVFVALMSTTTLAAGTHSSGGSNSGSAGVGVGVGVGGVGVGGGVGALVRRWEPGV